MNDSKTQKDVTGWVGWIYFAGMLMLLIGIFQTIAGFVALFKDDLYLTAAGNLLVFDYSQWGWIHIILGIVLVITSFSLMAGGTWGRILGSLLAVLSAIANFAFLSAYPVWSSIMITIDVLILYALIVHGHETKIDREMPA